MSQTDQFGRHEVLHAAHMISGLWAEHVSDHPAAQADAEVGEAAAKIGDAIAEFYQLCGTRFLGAASPTGHVADNQLGGRDA